MTPPAHAQRWSWIGQAVLFDSDGVLVDSTTAIERSWTIWCDEHGLTPERVMPRIHGRRAADAIAELVDADGVAAALARIEAIELAGAAEARPVAGAVALTESLAGARWAIVTSGGQALARARLAAAGVPGAPVLVSAEHVAAGKPAPDGYEAAARALGVSPADCVVFEDSASGAAAAHAAGAAVVGVGPRPQEIDHLTSAHVADLRAVTARRLDRDRLRLDLGPLWPGGGRPGADRSTITS